MPQPQPGILEIAPYKGGAAQLDGHANILKLSSNENPFGPPPSAVEAAAAVIAKAHRYPSDSHDTLRAAIGRVHGLDPNRIIVGAGSDEIIAFLCQAYSGPGTEVLYMEHGFAMHRISALAAGANVTAVAEKDRVIDVDAILGAVTSRTSLIFLTNPGNPTGTFLPVSTLERLAQALPERVVLAIDGAYAEYVEGYDGGASLTDSFPNVFCTRTFSKIYGLGGMRVGWGYGPAEMVDVLNRIRGPFNVTAPSLAAAEAAVNDASYVTECRAANAEAREWLAQELAGMGIPSDPSYANFIVPRFATPEEAVACDEALNAQGILVRRVAGYGLPNHLRITVGSMEECRRVADVIRAFKS